MDEAAQSSQSFIKPDGIYSPTLVLHVTIKAVTHLQSAFASILPHGLQESLLYLLKDILAHNGTIDGLLDWIEKNFVVCATHNIHLHPAKCIFFAKEVSWCGRFITADGIRYDPRRLDGLLSMEPPTTGAHLQQFVCVLQWVKNGIPSFVKIVAPLQEFMERVYDHAGQRTKKSVDRISLESLQWGQTELEAFELCNKSLANQVTLAHRDCEKRLCIYTDASNIAWSGMITQVPYKDLYLPHVEQKHDALAFISGRFNTTQLGWAIVEREPYAVMATPDRMHWIAAKPDGFDLFTDHNNLIFLFDPLSVMPDLSQTSVLKVLR